MDYKEFSSDEEFVQSVFEIIDTVRTMALLNNPNQEFKETKGKTLKSVLGTNIKLLFPDMISQWSSDVEISFTTTDLKSFCRIGNFYFFCMNIRSSLSAPVYTVFFIGEDGCLRYFIPSEGNTVNLISNKPFGLDNETDEGVCQSVCGCSIEQLAQEPEKYQNFDMMMEEVKRTFNITSYSSVEKLDIKMNVSNLYEFTKSKHTKLL